MTVEFSLPLRVYMEDTDAGGIVYYVNYLKFMERARTEYMRSVGYSKTVIFSEQLMFVVQDVKVRYIQPARLDDHLQATVTIAEVRGASMIMQHGVLRNDEVLAEGTVRIACVDRDTLKPRRLPGTMLEKLRQRGDH